MDGEIQNEKKGGNMKKVLLSIITIIIILLIGLVCFMYFGNKNNNVYIRTIDEFASSFNKTINKININEKNKFDINMSFNLSTTNKQYKKIANVINNMKLKTTLESDYNNKKINTNYDVLYNNESIINANLYIYDKDIYTELPTLYSKLIKVPTDDMFDLNELWNSINVENSKTFITEMTKIIKNNLKEEYFASEDEMLNVLDKEVLTNKQVLFLTGKDIYELENNIINDILNNDKLLKVLSEYSNLTVDDLKEELNNAKKEIVQSEDSFKAEIYLNKKKHNLEKVLITYGNKKIELNKTSEDNFKIVFNEEKVGTLLLKKDEIVINIDYLDSKINYSISKDKIVVSTEYTGMKYSITINGNEEKGNAIIEVNIPDEKILFNINIDYTINKVKSINDKDVSNYINIDEMTEKDIDSITDKLYKNETLTKLIQDLSSITSGILF